MTDFSFEAKNKTLSDVLFGQRKFRIPRFQRPYAWGNDEISELWEDLNTSDEPYFLGSLILNKAPESDEGFLDIIDGQQRLLSITILIAVLRDILHPLDAARAGLLQRQDIAIEDREGSQSFRITPADSLREFFLTHIQKDESPIGQSTPSSPEEKRVKENYEHLHSRISEELQKLASKEERIKFLNDLRKKVAELIVISVEIGNEDDAYEIFETTNARGLELSVGDLLKNLVFKKLKPGDDKDFAKEEWGEITSCVESTGSDLRRFLRYFWISRYSWINEKRLYREIKSKVTDWQGFLDNLWEDASWFNKLFVGAEQDFSHFKHGAKLYDSVFALRLMQVTQCFVLLMAIMRNHGQLGTDPVKVVQFLERFAFQYSAICKLPTNRVDRIYSRAALEIEKIVHNESDQNRPKRIQQVFSALQKDLREAAPSRQAFIDAFCQLSYKNSDSGRRLVKYVLAEVDKELRTTDEHRIDFDNVNIEHVLPQKPHKDWLLDRKVIKPYVNLLGNLTLLSKRLNSRAQNDPIGRKLLELEKSELTVTKELVGYARTCGEQWGEPEIRERQRLLAERAYDKIWAL